MGLWSKFYEFYTKNGSEAAEEIEAAMEKLCRSAKTSSVSDMTLDLWCSRGFGASKYASTSIAGTVDAHRELSKLADDLLPKARQVEQAAIDAFVEEMSLWIDEFGAVNSWIRRSDMDYRKNRTLTQITRILEGELVGYLKTRFSLEDPGCAGVLGLEDDTQRRAAAKAFKKKTLAEAQQWFRNRVLTLKGVYTASFAALARRRLTQLETEQQAAEALLDDLIHEKLDAAHLDEKRRNALLTVEKLDLLQALLPKPGSSK